MSADRPWPGGEGGALERVLHQPPNPRDLELFPPASTRCATIRGLLRDAADGDLQRIEHELVMEHVQGCRSCAVALSRAEHEVWLLRKSLGGKSLGGKSLGGKSLAGTGGEARPSSTPAAGFTNRVLNRLVLDETSILSREVLEALRQGSDDADPAVDAAGPVGQGPGGDLRKAASSPRSRAGLRRVTSTGSVVLQRERSRALPVRSLLFGLCASVLLLVGILAFVTRFGDVFAPQSQARLLVTAASNARDGGGRLLGLGQGLGEGEPLAIGRRGSADLEFHDSTAGNQPAARMRLGGDARMKLKDGVPMLLGGDVNIESRRHIKVPLADGGAIGLGTGDYRLSVESARRRHGWDENWQDLPAELKVSVEVLGGQPAEILTAGGGKTLVAVGEIGSYRTGGDPIVSRGTGSSAVGEQATRQSAPPPLTESEVLLHGGVFERSGQPVGGANVAFGFLRDGQLHSTNGRSGFDGSLSAGLGRGNLGNFAIVYAEPPSSRPDLCIKAPSAVPVTMAGDDATLAHRIVLSPSVRLTGTLVDDIGMGRPYVRIQACVVDEWLGCVINWPGGLVTSNLQGGFEIAQLPYDLPPHQHLVLLLMDPTLQTTVVPVPVRGDVAALSVLPVIRMAPLRTIDVRGLLPDTEYTVYEEVPNLPSRVALWQRTVRTDLSGRVEDTCVGGDVLWVQETGKSTVRELRFSQQNTVRVYQPFGPIEDIQTAFPPLDTIPGTSLLLASASRYKFFDGGLFQPSGSPVQFVDQATGHPVSGVEVFTMQGGAQGGAVGARFAGFAGTDANGDPCVSTIRDLAAGESLLAIGADGSVGWLPAGQWAPNAVVTMQSPGRVLVDPALRPQVGSPVEVLTLRFERSDITLPGLSPVAVRFACAANGWEVGGLVPGEYRVLIDSSAYSVVVPASGFVRLH
ncbi:MAG: zf-HC2 domain-containing protein [Planctomycetes bacterium]|nr:zf-HC2 domain-containing protein [Planctomycetota bacterium]